MTWSACCKRTASSHDRMRGTGIIAPDDALALSFTGPVLRSAGVDFDVRKTTPYLVYERLDFDVPLGDNGDNYDRYLVRMEEIRAERSPCRSSAWRGCPRGPCRLTTPA